jgi:hypothetical protein
MAVTRERIELAILDSLAQTGAAAGGVDADTRVESLGLMSSARISPRTSEQSSA